MDIHEYGIQINDDHVDIYLFGDDYWGGEGEPEPGVEYKMANRLIKNLHIAEDLELPVTLHMKTCGGYWEEGMAIYDVVHAFPYKVIAINYSHARSMSSLIFLAADYRYMMPHSTFMFHMGTMSQEGTVKQFETEAEQLKISSEQMLDIYTDHLYDKEYKKTKKAIREWLVEQMDKKEEVYFSAKQAVEIGFADEII